MSKIDKSLLLVAAAVFAAKGNEGLNAVGVTPNGQAFANLDAAKAFAKKHKQDGESLLITRADVEAGLAEEAPADNNKEAKEGYAAKSNAELKALVKERGLAVADNKNATLIAALEADDIAKAEADIDAAAAELAAKDGEGANEGEGSEDGAADEPKDETPQA